MCGSYIILFTRLESAVCTPESCFKYVLLCAHSDSNPLRVACSSSGSGGCSRRLPALQTWRGCDWHVIQDVTHKCAKSRCVARETMDGGRHIHSPPQLRVSQEIESAIPSMLARTAHTRTHTRARSRTKSVGEGKSCIRNQSPHNLLVRGIPLLPCPTAAPPSVLDDDVEVRCQGHGPRNSDPLLPMSSPSKMLALDATLSAYGARRSKSLKAHFNHVVYRSFAQNLTHNVCQLLFLRSIIFVLLLLTYELEAKRAAGGRPHQAETLLTARQQSGPKPAKTIPGLEDTGGLFPKPLKYELFGLSSCDRPV